MKKEKVIIIGAGPAGLTAAYKLLKENNKKYEVVILEKSSDIGGISKTVKYKGNRMDIGGHRFFSKSKEVMDLWQEIMQIQGKNSIDDIILDRKKNLPKQGPDPEKEDKCLLVRNRVSRIYYLKHFFDYPISMSVKTIKNMGFKNTLLAGFSYLKTSFHKKEENNLENFYINRFGKKLYSMFFEEYTEKLWGIHPSKISANWGAQRVKGLSISKVLQDTFKRLLHINNKNKETSLIEEFYYPKFGPGQLWEEMAKQVENLGGTILKHHEVTKINFNNKKITSVICKTKESNKEITGDIFISSMPFSQLILNLNGNKEVPKKIIDIAENLPFRDFITVGILVDKLLIENKTKIKTLNNIIPDCWIYVQEPNIKMCRFQIFNNWSPYMVEKPKERVWIGLEYTCNEKDDIWKVKNKAMAEFAIDEMIKMGIIKKESVIDYHIEKVEKAYPAYFGSYENIDQMIEYINKFNNLYLIGRNGQHRYNNMDHSMLTALEAVKNIENKVKSKENIWNVNTEKEYHEVKNEKNINSN
ncbi:MAG: NAD(P)/FAD-dependent oxidoreductase [Bacilli bacterium]|nr:NAD(P)/FAD-dependent oxidoreductase [Bacilli bacterium]